MISPIARLKNGPLILKNAMLEKKGESMLSKNKNSGVDSTSLPTGLKPSIDMYKCIAQ